MDELDKRIVNLLQKGFPLSECPYADVAGQLDITESELLDRLRGLLFRNILSRFGPMYDVEKLGGAFSLVAIKVPAERYEEVADFVNSYPQVAHNYQREHEYNMWYVLATDSKQQIDRINQEIAQHTGLKVWNMPKLHEYYIGLQLVV